MYGAGYTTGYTTGVTTEYVESSAYVAPTTTLTTEYVSGTPVMSHCPPYQGVGTTYIQPAVGTTYVQPTVGTYGTTYVTGAPMTTTSVEYVSAAPVVQETVYHQY